MDPVVDDNTNLLEFIKTLKEHQLLKSRNETGSIVYADDQYVNREALKMTMQDVGLADRFFTF